MRCLGLVVVVVIAGCRLPPEREALKPLPDAGLFAYPEMLNRARLIANNAIEAFYIDNWHEMEDAAGLLEQTAKVLPRTTDQPAKVKDTLTSDADLLRDEAQKLAAAAKNRDVRQSTEILGRIHAKIRALKE